jgi:site-specific DNA recombinase
LPSRAEERTNSNTPIPASPIRAERRAGLIRAIARGRQWLDEIVAGTTSIDGLAQRQNCSVRQINMTLSMAFLAPAIVKAAIEGRLPRGIGIAQLRDWSEQFKQLGLPCQGSGAAGC